MSIIKQSLSTKERRGILLLIGILCGITILFCIKTELSNENYDKVNDKNSTITYELDTLSISTSKNKISKKKKNKDVGSPLSRPMTKHIEKDGKQ